MRETIYAALTVCAVVALAAYVAGWSPRAPPAAPALSRPTDPPAPAPQDAASSDIQVQVFGELADTARRPAEPRNDAAKSMPPQRHGANTSPPPMILQAAGG